MPCKGSDIVCTRGNRPAVGMVSISGVVIQVHREHLNEFWATAQALTSALSAEGVAAKAEPGVGAKNTNLAAIHILIGKKS